MKYLACLLSLVIGMGSFDAWGDTTDGPVASSVVDDASNQGANIGSGNTDESPSNVNPNPTGEGTSSPIPTPTAVKSQYVIPLAVKGRSAIIKGKYASTVLENDMDGMLTRTMVALNQVEPAMATGLYQAEKLAEDHRKGAIESYNQFVNQNSKNEFAKVTLVNALNGCIYEKVSAQTSWIKAFYDCLKEQEGDAATPEEQAVNEVSGVNGVAATYVPVANETSANTITVTDYFGSSELKQEFVSWFGDYQVSLPNNIDNGTVQANIESISEEDPKKRLEKIKEEFLKESYADFVGLMSDYCKKLQAADRKFFFDELSDDNKKRMSRLSALGVGMNWNVADAWLKIYFNALSNNTKQSEKCNMLSGEYSKYESYAKKREENSAKEQKLLQAFGYAADFATHAGENLRLLVIDRWFGIISSSAYMTDNTSGVVGGLAKKLVEKGGGVTVQDFSKQYQDNLLEWAKVVDKINKRANGLMTRTFAKMSN